MATERVKRRLAAILAADVVGYSRLMGADEEGTLARLKTLRRELADPKIKEYHGRIVKTTGDGLLISFGSVVDAVRCTVDVQREMAQLNAEARDTSGDERPVPAGSREQIVHSVDNRRGDLRVGKNGNSNPYLGVRHGRNDCFLADLTLVHLPEVWHTESRAPLPASWVPEVGQTECQWEVVNEPAACYGRAGSARSVGAS
jgi:hypothetical protein